MKRVDGNFIFEYTILVYNTLEINSDFDLTQFTELYTLHLFDQLVKLYS
jgi:hypothetical protein